MYDGHINVHTAKEELSKIEQHLLECDNIIEEKNEVLNKLDYHFEQFKSWADEFEYTSMEQKKMILCQLTRSLSIIFPEYIEVRQSV